VQNKLCWDVQCTPRKYLPQNKINKNRRGELCSPENSECPCPLAKRKNIRLKDYDYSQEGYYFITICTKNKKEILGKIVGANCVRPKTPDDPVRPKNNYPTIILTKIGKIVENEMNKISKIYNNILIDEYIIMPNHIHVIIEIENGRTQFAPTISQIIKQYKGSITKQIKNNIWQKSFYEHIIRNEKEYLNIKQYIINNPYNWKKDKYYS